MNPDWHQWRNGLFSFCDIPDLCCLLVFCPACICCVQGKSVAIATDSGCCGPCMLAFCCGCIGHALNRTSIRNKINIEGGCCGDCCTWCCFPISAAIQERKEAKLFKERGGSMLPSQVIVQYNQPVGYSQPGYPQPGYPQPGYPQQGYPPPPHQGNPPPPGHPHHHGN